MSAQHTPGRLTVAVEIFDNDGMPETALQALGGAATVAVALDFGSNNPGMREANARRLVACWNACEGIDTEYLEGDDSLPHYARRLMAQRDELLAELERERESRKTAQMRLHDEYERRSKTGLQHNMEKSRLMRQRDELLAALKVAISRQAYRPGEGPDWWENGCAVIAKVEGGEA